MRISKKACGGNGIVVRFAIGISFNARSVLHCAGLAVMLFAAIEAPAATFIWSGSGAGNNWSTAGNWAGNVAPANDGTAVIVLAGINQLTPNVDVSWTINSLTFSNNAGPFVLGGNSLTIRGGIVNSDANTQTINNVITLQTNQTWNAAAGMLTFGGNINNNNYLLTISGNSNSTISGVVSGAGGLTKTGTGVDFLTGANTYSGPTLVNMGVLNIQNSLALGSAAGTTVASGAALQLQGGISVTGPLNLSGTGLAGSGALRNIGGSNSWYGTITMGATCAIDSDAGALDLEANIINSTFTTTFTNIGTIILNGALGSGTGAVVKNGTGLLSLGGANTSTGSTTINAGTVQFSAPGSASSASAVTVNAGCVLDLNGFNETIGSLTGAGSVTLGNGALTVNNSTATTFSGVMSGAGSLVQAGTGTMTLSGVNIYTGGTTINAGAISIAANTGLGNTNGALTLNGGQLTTSASLTSARAITLGTGGGAVSAGGTTLTLSGLISGPGALTKIGTKTLALTGTNTFSGGTTVGAGTLAINSDAALGNPGGSITLSNSTLSTTASFSTARSIYLNSGTNFLLINKGFTNTFSGVISGTAAVTKSGTGILILTGNNTFTNTFFISAGTLQLGASERLADSVLVNVSKSSAIFNLNNFTETIGGLTGPGKVTLGSGTLIADANNNSTTYSGVISGTGNFTKVGTGLMVFSNANTYTGTTTVGAGTLQISAGSEIAGTSPLVVSNGAVFNLNNFNQTVASLAGAGSVTLGSGTMTAGNAGNTVFSGSISGTGSFTKVGAGTQIFNGTNSYSGATAISVGNLQVNGSNASSAVTIASAATLSGGGTVGTVNVNSGATISPGAGGPGTLTSGAQTWAGGGNYVWEINNPTGTAGGSSGWDWLNISGPLTITANFGGKFNLNLVSLTAANAAGVLSNFNNTVTYIWTIASASGGITGFNAANFNINAVGFQNSLGAGTFTLSQSGNDLNLIFTSAALAAIKDVQSGTLTSSGAGTNTVSLGTAINPTNAFLIFNTRHNSSVPGGSMIRGYIASSNTVAFVRATTETSTMNIQWYVAEYSAGVNVQSGQVNQTNTIINVPIIPISATNQAFVLWSKTPDPAETAFTDSDPVVGEITSVSNLQFRVTAAPSSVPVISWQVVQFLNPASIGVQHGSITNLTGTNLLATATLPSPVDPTATFLLTGYRTSGSGTNIGARMLRAQLASATNLVFDRSISGAPDDVSEIAWQAIQLKDGSLAQNGSVNFTNGIAETNVTLTASLNTNRAIALSFVQPAGGQNTGRSPSTGNVLGVGSATLAMTSISQLILDRNNTDFQADIGWSVVGLGPGSILAPAIGGTAISADTTTNTYTSLIGPVYTEIQNGDVGVGTIILKTPAGFIFDTNTVQPAVLITRVGGSGANSLNINGVASGTAAAMTTVNQTNLTFTVTSASSGGVVCSLTWQNLRVRPSAGTPLAGGNIVATGTSTIQGVTTNSTSWGFLAEVVGAAAQVAISTTPSSTVTAGVSFPQQPVIQIQDQFGNLRTADNTDVVTAVSSGTDANNVNGSLTAVGGIAAFSAMSYQVAQTNTITFSAPGLSSKTSGNIVVSAAAASQVTVVTQPSAAATAGVNFAQQPVVQVQDAFGNLVKTDSSTVTASIDQGSGNLFGTQAFQAVNGVATFTNLSYQVAETITIDFTDGSLDFDTSAGTAVGAGAASQLVIQTQPPAIATAGVPFAQQPVILVEDQFGNLCTTNNSTVVSASRDAGSGGGVLQGGVNVTASGGVAAFASLSHNVATTISVDFNSSPLTGATSGSILVNPAAAAALAFATQPGSATVGSIFGIQPALITQDSFGNNSISGLASSLPVTVALTSGTGTLLGTTRLDIGTAAGNGAVAFANLEIDSAGGKQLTAGASGLSSAVSSSFSVAQSTQTITFGPLPNQTYGVAPFTVSASASSGLPITFSLVSGPAGVSSSNVTVTGVGTVTVGANQPGNSNYLAASTVNQSFTVAQRVLTVTANNTSRIYGAASPVLTANYSGFVNGDTLSGAVTGSPALNTAAATNSSVAGNPYVITIASGTLSATNYSFSFVSGQLTITPANSTLAVSTSANPSPTGSNVTFTATATAVSPGSGTPTGTIQYFADGTALGSPAAMSGGIASVGTSSFSHGSHVVTALYAGDGNFFGCTNGLSPNQLIDSPPVTANATLQRSISSGVKVRATTLLANDTDPDGDVLALISVSPTSASGGTIVSNGGWTFYEPPPGFTNADSFSYVIADSYGLQATGTVSIAIFAGVAQSQNIGSVVNLGNNASLINFNGIPGRTYTIQYAGSLQTPIWQPLGTAATDMFGNFNFTDSSATNSPSGFYRSTYP